MPFDSFPINLNVLPIIPAGAGPELRDHPVGTGPYEFVRYNVDDEIELKSFRGYFLGPPKNDGLVFKIIPDDVMRGLELRKGTVDIVLNDVAPDIVFQLRKDPHLQTVEAPGVDYQYVGVNLRDPILKDVRRASGARVCDRSPRYRRLSASWPCGRVDRHAAAAVVGLCARQLRVPPRSRARPERCSTRPAIRIRTAIGPLPRLTLTLKTTNTEFNRLQSALVQQNLRDIGVALDVRMYEFATLYARCGRRKLPVLFPAVDRWIACRSRISCGACFTRIRFRQPVSTGDTTAIPKWTGCSTRRARPQTTSYASSSFRHVQRIVAQDLPYISLWYKTNFAVAQRTLTGVHLTPLADLDFLRDVARVPASAAN